MTVRSRSQFRVNKPLSPAAYSYWMLVAGYRLRTLDALEAKSALPAASRAYRDVPSNRSRLVSKPRHSRGDDPPSLAFRLGHLGPLAAPARPSLETETRYARMDRCA